MFNDAAFTLFAMEQEGDLDTREGKINRAIKELRKTANPNDAVVRAMVYQNCGLTNVSSWEENRIQKGIMR